MDSGDRQRAALPPIKTLDFEKVKREEADYQARSTNMPPSAVSSPVHQYPSGPPPPYSHPSIAAARTPPETRRSSGDDQPRQAPKQSLPSIHEALGVEQPISYSSQTAYSSAPQPAYQAPAPASPPVARRSFAMEPPPPPAQHSAPASHGPRSPYSQPRREVSPRQIAEPVDRRGSVFTAQPPPPSPLQHQSQYPRSYPAPTHSPTHERAPSHPVSMAPAANFPYGYTSYPAPHYAPYGPPPPAPTTSSIYQPSVTQPAPSHAEPAYRHGAEPGRNPFGESVKRHLDMWDFGEALNEVAEASSYALEFSRQCGARLHQTQRSDPVPGTLPQVHEIDHLMEKSRRQMECYAKMREFIVTQQTVYFQQAQEQQYRAQDVMKRDSVHQVEDKSGFAGTEAKKRRGRAAPPGRCHSCNRAETPEWRRGPDGARTLCNACGLHYAKLTRKAGKNAASIGSSNLRPKAAEDTQN